MSEVLIKGMKMPRTCAVCEWSDYLHPNAYCRREQTTVNIETAKTSRPDWCPLVEITTPHGDLVDRNYLIAEYDRQHKGPAGGARRIMEDAPTIIDAEGSDT